MNIWLRLDVLNVYVSVYSVLSRSTAQLTHLHQVIGVFGTKFKPFTTPSGVYNTGCIQHLGSVQSPPPPPTPTQTDLSSHFAHKAPPWDKISKAPYFLIAITTNGL